MTRESTKAVEVFYSYAHKDEKLRTALVEHLSTLRRQGYISEWHDRQLVAGTEWAQEIDSHLRSASLILLLISPSFIASDYCYGIEMQLALERHQAGQARVIPIILRPTDLKATPFATLQFLPAHGKAITTWQNRDEAFLDVARGIRTAIENLSSNVTSSQPSVQSLAQQLWNVPYQRNPYFTGRDTILQDLYDALNRDSTTALTQGHAIYGLGGIGKTQTAIEYTYRYRSEYRFIFWVRAETGVELQAGFVEIARLLDLPEKDATNPAEMVQAVKRWLEREGEWLLVFDNADTPELLKAYYPHIPRGHILLTSRAQLFDTLGIDSTVALERMQPDEALRFLYKRTKRAQNDPAEQWAAETLAADLGYLPLTLEQAAAYLAAKAARFQDYLASYRQRHLSLLNKAQPKTGDYPSSVARTWALNFQEVEQDKVAADILRMSAFLSPDAIPFELLTKGASQLGPVLAEALSSEDSLVLNEALEPLTRYSLIRMDVETQSYSIHRMVQEVLKDQMGAESQAQWAERVVRAVSQSFPKVDYQTWSHCERLIPHALLCAEYIDHWSLTFLEAHNLLFQVGNYFYQRGQYWEGESLWKSDLAFCEQLLGSEHPDTLGTVHKLASLNLAQGQYEQAEPLYQRALLARERVLGPEDNDTLQTVNNLAFLYTLQGKYEQAEPLHQRTLEARERLLGSEHPSTLHTLNNLAFFYADQGKYEEAEPLYQQALDGRKRVLGLEHPDTLDTVNNLAILYADQGKYEQAEALYQQALTIRERVLGPEHPKTADSLNNLAWLYYRQGKYEQAEPLYQRTLAIYERVLGPENRYTADTLSDLALLYQEWGKYEQAEPLYLRALNVWEQIMGPGDSFTETTRLKLARFYIQQGKYEQARAVYAQAVPPALNDATAYLDRGYLFLHLKNRESAHADFVRLTEFQPKNVNAAWMAAYTHLGKQKPGVEISERLEAIAELDPESNEACVCRGVALDLRGKLQEGLAELEHALSLDAENEDAWFWKGVVCACLGRDATAMESIEQALKAGLPPILLTPLYWLEQDSPNFYQAYAEPLLKRYELI